MSSSSLVTIVEGDLFETSHPIVVQQCNCLTTKPHRLSLDMVKRFGAYANAYRHRKNVEGRNNLARIEDRDMPGSCRLLKPPATEAHKPTVACLYAQWSPGSVNSHWPVAYPALVLHEKEMTETTEMREAWFEEALKNLNSQLEGDKKTTTVIAFPYAIGCGQAGGNWNTYKAMIEDFAQYYQWNVVMYKKV